MIIVLYVLFSTMFCIGVALEGDSDHREKLPCVILKSVLLGWLIFPFAIGMWISETHDYMKKKK